MSWIKFCRLNEEIENVSQTESIRLIKDAWDSFNNKMFMIRIFCLEYPMSNIGSKKIVKWVAEALGVFEEEFQTYIDIHGDIGEAVYYFTDSSEHSEYTIPRIESLLSLDYANMTSRTFDTFDEYFNNMSALEKKWFLRYLIRKPRHGVGEGTVLKLLASVYGKTLKEVKKDRMFNSVCSMIGCYERKEKPENKPVIGNFIKPMLAKAIPKNKWPKSSNRILEYKYDGARYQIHKNHMGILIFNRKGKFVNEQFPDIEDEVDSWGISNFIIDTEIYPIKADGTPAAFQAMNVRFHSKDHAKAVLRCPVALAVFDVMVANDTSYMEANLTARIAALRLFPHRAVFENDGKKVNSFYSKAIKEGFEGIMIKSLDAIYESGKRSTKWVKFKPPRIELDVVITGARYGDGKRAGVMASFDIAVKDGEGDFIEIGAIGTGFNDFDFAILTQRLRSIVKSFENNTHKVLPKIVLEITSDLVTKNESGSYGLRFPRLIRIREDKSVNDINTINDVMGMM